MKKSNIVLTVVFAVVSVVLLALWYLFGFDKVDAPLDLIISAVWWVVIAVGAVALFRAEKERCRRVRTVYVGEGRLYNSEAGVLALSSGAAAVDTVATVLANLEYDFSRAEAPAGTAWRYVVRTEKFSAADAAADAEWKGEVVTVATGAAHPFSSRAELAKLIAA